MSFKYIERIYELLKTIETEECENIKKAVDMLYEKQIYHLHFWRKSCRYFK